MNKYFMAKSTMAKLETVKTNHEQNKYGQTNR